MSSYPGTPQRDDQPVRDFVQLALGRPVFGLSVGKWACSIIPMPAALTV